MGKLFWTQKQDIGPSPRVLHALAYHGASGRTILFGGDSLNGQKFGDTWAWDGDNWTQLDDIGPAPRADHALVYDLNRDRLVMFGGTSASGSVGDTWEWGNEAWTQVADTGPSARSGHSMVFDRGRQRVLLFGGGPGTGPNVRAALNDTWEWDGTDWVQVDDVGPSPRRGHSMAFDSVRASTVLFGGLSTPSLTALGDTWEYAGGRWTEVEDTGPSPCFQSALVFKTKTCSLFGGASAPAGGATPPSIFHLSWEWNGIHWTARQDIGPGARVGHAMAYDSARSRVVLFGGTSVPVDDPQAGALVRGDTWEQFETGVSTVATPEVALAAFSINPLVVVPGNSVSFEVALVAPAGASGQTVPVVDETNSPMLGIIVAGGSTVGQEVIQLDPNLGAYFSLPLVIDFTASAGGISMQAQLTINP